MLLPFAQHLPLVRAAWASLAGAPWMPRFETTRTLAAALAPPTPPSAGAPGFDMTVDRLVAAGLLAGSVPDWPRRDARGFELAVRRVVELAQALARARAALPPAARAAWIAAARERLAGGGGPAQAERSLARLAFEWSLAASCDVEDRLFAHRPAAWVALRVGAAEPLAESLLSASEVPALWLDADRPPALPPAGATLAVCSGFEDEAQRAAAAVLDHLRHSDAAALPIALIALDRSLVRRIRALLERAGVALADETGWKLSTTRAAARVLSLLRAAGPRADTDELLDLLKSLPDRRGVDALEAVLRRRAWSVLAQVDEARLEDDAARAAWQRAVALTEPLRAGGRATLSQWLLRLREALQRAGLADDLLTDAAGAQVLAALRCTAGAGDAAFIVAAGAAEFTAAGFVAWVDDVLENAPFRPPEDAAPQVVITPLARALLRPFGAIVCPGADATHLGAGVPPEPLLGDASATALGLPGVAARREAERQAFAQLARTPRLSLLHRQADGSEPVSASPLLRRWQLAAARSPGRLTGADDLRERRLLPPRLAPRPLPSAPALLPERYSASRYEHLRACPYRFYAAAMLRLDEVEELDDELEKRDAGTWLHAVLQRFHAERPGGNAAAADLEHLLAIADDEARHRFGTGPLAADFLPYAAWFEGVAPAYVEWLGGAEAEGWAVQASELALRAPVAAGEQRVLLDSRLDRVDERYLPSGEDAGRHRRLIDYKLRSKSALQGQVRVPFEDTQLAFYALLLARAEGWPEGGLEAGYLALDGREGVAWVAHRDVAESAQALHEGLVADIVRLRSGAALPALGEGAACEHCAARGLCRRDFWEPPR